MDGSLNSIDPDSPGHGVREQQGDTSPPSSMNRAVIAGAIGNFVECFDWFAYALFASYLSRLVFPSGDPLGALLSTFAVFAIGFSCGRWGASSLESTRIGMDARMRWPRRFSSWPREA